MGNFKPIKRSEIVSLVLAAYSCLGLILLAIMSGRFNEIFNQGLNISTCLVYSIPFAVLLFLLLFLNFRRSFRVSKKHEMSQVLFGSISFAIFSVSTGTVLFMVQVNFSWATVLQTIIPGGIIGWSHGSLLGLQKSKDELHKMSETTGDGNLFSKALELEHNLIQTLLNWILWASIVFLTAGFAAYYIATPQFLFPRLTNAIIIVVWAIIGIIFGVVMPMTETMRLIRKEIFKKSCK